MKFESEWVKLNRKLAEQGDASAQNILGNLYIRGTGVEQNNTEGAKWLRNAAEQGYVMAQLKLGDCYANGKGVVKNKA